MILISANKNLRIRLNSAGFKSTLFIIKPGYTELHIFDPGLKFWVISGREVRAEPGLKPGREEAGTGDDLVLLMFKAQ